MPNRSLGAGVYFEDFLSIREGIKLLVHPMLKPPFALVLAHGESSEASALSKMEIKE